LVRCCFGSFFWRILLGTCRWRFHRWWPLDARFLVAWRFEFLLATSLLAFIVKPLFLRSFGFALSSFDLQSLYPFSSFLGEGLQFFIFQFPIIFTIPISPYAFFLISIYHLLRPFVSFLGQQKRFPLVPTTRPHSPYASSPTHAQS